MKILEYEVPENHIYDVVTALEKVKAGYRERVNVKLPEGWKLSVSRFVEADGLKDYLNTGLAVRMANYANGIKDTAIVLYPDIEYWIKEGQEELKYQQLTIKSGSLFLIKKFGSFFISNGIDNYEVFEEERKKVAYALRNCWYYRSDLFYITDKLATFKGIPIKEPVDFYILMEV